MSADPIIDLSRVLDAAGDGVHWSLDTSEDLNANLVRLGAGSAIGEHVNDAVDVLVVVVAGQGTLTLDGRTHALRPPSVTVLPRGSRRRIQAGDDEPGLTYLTVHRRRGLLSIAPASRRRPEGYCDEGGEAPCLAPLLDDDGTLPHRTG